MWFMINGSGLLLIKESLSSNTTKSGVSLVDFIVGWVQIYVIEHRLIK